MSRNVSLSLLLACLLTGCSSGNDSTNVRAGSSAQPGNSQTEAVEVSMTPTGTDQETAPPNTEQETNPESVPTLEPVANDSTNLCEGFFANDKTNRPMQSQAKPAPGESYIDTVFGSAITRISHSEITDSGVIKTMYSTVQAWNADESMMILYHRGDGHYLYNGHSPYSLIERLNIVPVDLEQVFWNSENKDLFIYPNQAKGAVLDTANGSYTTVGNELMEYSVTNKTYKVLKDFNSHCGADNITAGGDVQMTSIDSDVVGLRCNNIGFRYRISTNELVEMSFDTEYMAPQVFPSGELSYHRGKILDSNMQLLRTLDAESSSEHSNLGQMLDGNDAYFAVAFGANSGSCESNIEGTRSDGVGSLVVHDVTDGYCRVLVGPDNGYPYSLSGTHVNAGSYRNPGWAVVSSVGYGIEGDSLLEQELYLANTDPIDPVVCRIAHHRSAGRRGSVGYFAEPHPVLSPTGTRVLYSSDWNDSGNVDVYVVELPSYLP